MSPPARGLVPALAFALTFPTLAAWLYFLALAGPGGRANVWQQAAYTAAKAVQFAFPVVYLAAAEGRFPRPGRPRFPGLALGLAFGALVAALIVSGYFGLLRGSPLLAQTPARIRQRLQEMGMDTPARYAALAVFLSAAHSLMEEYYWRWFVFGRLRQRLAQAPAVALSSLAFMAHHVVVLYVFLPGRFWALAVPASLAVAAGGAVWAWLYERGNSVWSPWLSHLLVDAALLAVGADMVWKPLAT